MNALQYVVTSLVLTLTGTMVGAEPAEWTRGSTRRLTTGDRLLAERAMRLERFRNGQFNVELWNGRALTDVLVDLAHVELEAGDYPLTEAAHLLVFRRPGGARFIPCLGPVPILHWSGRVALPQYASRREEIERAVLDGRDASILVSSLRQVYVSDHPRSLRTTSVDTWRGYNAGLVCLDDALRNLERASIDSFASSPPCLVGSDLTDLVQFVRSNRVVVCGAMEDAAIAETFDVAFAAWIEHRGDENPGRVEAYRSAREAAKEQARLRAIQGRRAYYERRQREEAAKAEYRLRLIRATAQAHAQITAAQSARFGSTGSRSTSSHYWYSVPVRTGGSTIHVGGPARTTTRTTTRTIRIR